MELNLVRGILWVLACNGGTHCSSGTATTCTGLSRSAVAGAQAINNTTLGSENVTFIIGAVGDLNGSQDDEWTMTHGKVLANEQDGTE